MEEFFFGLDSIKNYFSEVIGIIATVFLFPLFNDLYKRNRLRSFRFLFYDRVFSYSSFLLDEYVEDAYKSPSIECLHDCRKKLFTLQPKFIIKDLDLEKIKEFYINEFEAISKGALLNKINNIENDFNNLHIEINSWILIYDQVMDEKLHLLVHKIIYEIRTFKFKYGKYPNDKNPYFIINYAEYIAVIISLLISITVEIRKKYPINN